MYNTVYVQWRTFNFMTPLWSASDTIEQIVRLWLTLVRPCCDLLQINTE